MSKKIIANINFQETRVAILEDDVLMELYVEGKTHQRIAGNIHKGVVTKVLPGMQAAFVNVGLAKDAFLYVMDVYYDIATQEKGPDEDEGAETEPPTEAGDEELLEQPVEKLVSQNISDILRVGQQVLVQISKEPIGTKGARATSHITLPGRYLVYMPTVNHVGVSKRIRDEAERERLRNIVRKLRQSNHGGFIVRTVGEGREEEDFAADLASLTNLWQKIQKRAEAVQAPQLIHADLDLLLRIIRDYLSPEIEELCIDSESDYLRSLEYIDTIQPKLTGRVKLYVKPFPIFEEYGIEDEIEKALHSKVWLKSGGYIVVDQTEALVAIDVNTGKYVGKRNLEDTITKINVEAAKEIVRQIRLRDLGGIIIIDFIDMEREENKQHVFQTLHEELKKDRSKSSILPLSELGLVQMTRKRVKRSLGDTMCRPCPYCYGRGHIKSIRTIIAELQREVMKLGDIGEEKEILMRVHPQVAAFLRREDRSLIQEIETTTGATVTIRSDESLHHEQYDILCL